MSDYGDVWNNWAGSLYCVAETIERPLTVADVQAVVQKTKAEGGTTLRPFGTGHSWSPLVVNNANVLVDLQYLADPAHPGQKAWRWQQGELNLVTYLPSAHWSDVRDALVDPTVDVPRMYLPTAGVLPSINATGFVAAGCHGTGWNQPTVSDLVYGVKLVAADGQVHEFSEATTPDAMPAIRVSLGLLGIITEVTLKVVPLYNLLDVESSASTAAEMGPNPANGGSPDPAALEALVTGNEYVELFWFPWSGYSPGSLSDGSIWIKAFNTTTQNPGTVPPQPPDWQLWFAEQTMEIVAEYPTSHTPIAIVDGIEALVWNQLESKIAAYGSGVVGIAPDILHYQDKAFPVIDMEVAIPIPPKVGGGYDFTNIVTAWYQVVNQVRSAFESDKLPLTCCLHARFIKNSQSLLSPAYEPEGSDVHYCWIEFLSAYPKTADGNDQIKDVADFQALIDTVTPIWVGTMNGRPHWAKYWQTIPGIKAQIKSIYPQANLDAFNALRKTLDPDGLFLNGFLESLDVFV